jgi:hypothetical protein
MPDYAGLREDVMSTRHHNVPELSALNTDQRAVVDFGADAVAALKKTFDHWMAIAHGVAVLRNAADNLGGKKTFHRLLERSGYGTLLRAKAQLTRLVQMAARETEVRQWRDTLTEKQRWDWASPSAVFKHCSLFEAKSKTPTEDGDQSTTPSSFKKLRLEVVFDALDEHLHHADADGRVVIAERIAGIVRRYGWRVEQSAPTGADQSVDLAADEQQASLAEASQTEAAADTQTPSLHDIESAREGNPPKPKDKATSPRPKTSGALGWTDTRHPTSDHFIGSTAPACKGRYTIGSGMPVAFSGGGMTPGCTSYSVSYRPDGTYDTQQVLGEGLRTVDEAKRIAQRHHDAGKDQALAGKRRKKT